MKTEGAGRDDSVGITPEHLQSLSDEELKALERELLGDVATSGRIPFRLVNLWAMFTRESIRRSENLTGEDLQTRIGVDHV